MDKEKILKELYEKVNEWFAERPQRPIAQFMIETMWQYIEAAQPALALDAATAPITSKDLPADVLVGEGTLPEPPRQ